VNEPPAGYPAGQAGMGRPHGSGGGSGGGGADPQSVVSQLLGHFNQHTGEEFSGQSSQYQVLAKLASDKLGFPVPASLIEQLVGYVKK